MDILYQLPFPEDLCSKIFLYACKSPHTGLGVGMFENKLQIMDLDIPDKDKDIISFDADKQDYYTYNTIHIDIFTCFPNLNTIDLGGGKVRVSGDIGDLVSLKKLSVIDFYNKMDMIFFPSNLECFSATPIEALYMNRNIVCSNLAFNKNIIGKFGVYFEPNDPVSASEKIAATLKKQINGQLKEAKKFVFSNYKSEERFKTYINTILLNE